MRQIRIIALAAVVVGVAVPAAADGESRPMAGGCGGDAFSYAEVVTGRDAGPLVSLPDTLCADIEAQRPTRIESLSVYLGGQSAGPTQPSTEPTGRPQPRREPFRHR